MIFNHEMFEYFLSSFRPGGPWLIYARSLDDKGPMKCRKFEDVSEAAAWAAVMNSEQNPHQIYHQINLTRLSKKPKDVDIVEVEWLQADIDPRKGEEIEEAQVRIKTLLTEKWPKQLKPPTLIVYSGGGYQVYWQLAKPIEMDGTQAKIDYVKGFNRALAAFLDADSCFDICRVFRTPGSINWPNEKKQKRGQVPALAEVVAWHPDRVYEISEFVKADDEPTAQRQEIPQDVAATEVDDLCDYPVHPKCLDVITNGPGPEHPSRSEAVFYVACELVRAEVPDAVIYGILMNPTLEISEHILAQGDPRRTAIRTIERAREYTEDKDLAELNEKYAVLSNYGGKCLVMYERHNEELDRPELAFQTKAQFFDATANMPPIQIGEGKDVKYIPRARWWWTQRKRRQYETVVFVPGRTSRQEHYNLFQGFAYDPDRAGGSCDLFLEHIWNNICQKNSVHHNYLLGWMARAVQYPGKPGETAVVLQGDPGTGKSFFASHFGALFGRHFLPLSDSKHLLGSFNAHLQDCIVLFADEAISTADKAAISRLKARITEPLMTIEKKGVDAITSANCLHVIMASNDDWVVPVEIGDRRFFVLEVGKGRQRDNDYFGAIQKELEEGGYNALLRYLLDFDLSAYRVQNIPTTEAIQTQKEWSLKGMQRWWYDVLCRGYFCDGDEWPREIPTSYVFWDYCQFSDSHHEGRSLSISLGRFLKKVVQGLYNQRAMKEHMGYSESGELIPKKIGNFYRFPSLQDCRDMFDKNCGGPWEWPSMETVTEEAEGNY